MYSFLVFSHSTLSLTVVHVCKAALSLVRLPGSLLSFFMAAEIRSSQSKDQMEGSADSKDVKCPGA